MSVATERRAAKEVLARHCLMGVKEIAGLLEMDTDGVLELIRQGKIPAVNRGTRKQPYYAADPMDVAVFILAGEGMTVQQYWKKHGNEAADHARDYLERVKRFTR